jgi:hypothetical protein
MLGKEQVVRGLLPLPISDTRAACARQGIQIETRGPDDNITYGHTVYTKKNKDDGQVMYRLCYSRVSEDGRLRTCQ